MAKYSGLLGYVTQVEKVPGVWVPEATERKMRGDVLSMGQSYQQGEKVNDDIALNHRLSIVADPFLYENYTNIRYATYLGTKWRVASIEINRPRITLTLGGIWNGEE